MNGCPRCQQRRTVQRVSAIVLHASTVLTAEGVTVTTTNHQWSVGQSFLAGRLSSKLAEYLAPPRKPVNYDPFLLSGGVLAFAFALSCLCSQAAPVLWELVTDQEAVVNWAKADHGSHLLFAATIVIILLACCIGAGSFLIRQRSTSLTRQASFQMRLTQWERAMRRWEMIYYCHACDCVFVPGEGQSYPPHQIHLLL